MSMGADVSFALSLFRRREAGGGREDTVSVITIWAQREGVAKGLLLRLVAGRGQGFSPGVPTGMGQATEGASHLDEFGAGPCFRLQF